MSSNGVQALAGLETFLVRPVAEVAADLESFATLLRKWQPAQNLVSRETLEQMWTRHVRDSLQILSHLPPKVHQILDIGSGGGFPALPLAIALKGGAIQFTLVEANKRKCSFLRTVVRDLDLAAKVLDSRVESLPSAQLDIPDVITSRATAPLRQLLAWAYPLTGPATRLLVHKGREHGEEWSESAAHWQADVLILPSLTDPDGVVLDIRHLKHKSA